jgi:VIT1/CCC1 family predicted Fe2+/Mn2+ transporter/rubrerythrin
MADNQQLIRTLQSSWRREIEGAKMYRALAEREQTADRKRVLIRLAEAEEQHARRWKARIQELGGSIPDLKETFGDRIRRWILVRTGIENASKRLEETEDHDTAAYEKEAMLFEEEKDKNAIAEVEREERVHAKVLASMTSPEAPQVRLDSILQREKWHAHGAGGWIGQAIYGANDGLGATFGIVSGMAGYTGGSEVVLIAGLAGMLASSLSMGAGAYLASKSEREVYEAEIERERREIQENPEEEQEELKLFYQLKGFTEEQSSMLAKQLTQQPDQLLKTLAHEELGLSEATFPKPAKATMSAALSTAVGGLIPVLPFFFATGMTAVIASFIISTLAHFTIGASKTFVTGRSWVASGLEMTAVGIIEAAITYGLGILFSPVTHAH